MSEILESLPAPAVAPEHPFSLWADGQARILRPGEDFGGTTVNMIRQLRRAAAARGMTVAVRKLADGALAVQFGSKP